MGDVQLAAVDAASAEAREAMLRYFEELHVRFGFDPGESAFEDAAELYNPPAGLFLVARRAAAVVGCGAVTHLDDQASEVKRMWVAPEARGTGLGRRLLQALEEEARTSGRAVVVLDTNGTLTEARAMYERSGYEEMERYNENPYAEHWYKKHLD